MAAKKKVMIPLAEVEAIVYGDGITGFCLSCGESQDGVEPDACEYECESCGESTVYGAEEVLIMGRVS